MIAIKDFAMPKDCNDCEFFIYNANGENYCRMTFAFLYYPEKGKRDTSCPLIDTDPKTSEGVGYFQHGYDISFTEIKKKVVEK